MAGCPPPFCMAGARGFSLAADVLRALRGETRWGHPATRVRTARTRFYGCVTRSARGRAWLPDGAAPSRRAAHGRCQGLCPGG